MNIGVNKIESMAEKSCDRTIFKDVNLLYYNRWLSINNYIIGDLMTPENINTTTTNKKVIYKLEKLKTATTVYFC